MKRVNFLLLIFILLCKTINASDYTMLFLPDSIKKNANSILWKYDIEITINSDLSFTEKVHKIITILKPAAKEQAVYYGYESKLMSSVLKHGNVFDEQGNLLKKIKKSDLNTVAEYSEYISDFKSDYYNPEILKFPFTVEYEYETRYNYMLYLPEFNPYQEYNTSVINSRYIIHVPENFGIRIYRQNNNWNYSTEIKGGITTYTFVLDNKPCINQEINTPDFDKIAPRIITAPNQISYYGYKSKFENWTDFGNWIIQLNNKRDSLPEDVKVKLHQYKAAYPDIIERAKAIYGWIQENTRYYSIQLGLSGFQPMKTIDVNKNKYGDCKALSFYTKTLFKEAGIDAYYTLVNAGENKGIIKEIPANQFNHVIICLPLNNDTIWLECTDQKIPFGYLGDFTDDRDVLVINDQPSIAHTKSYSVNDNVKTVTANVIIDEEKNITGNLSYKTKGLQIEGLYRADYISSAVQQKKYLYELLDINNLELFDYSIGYNKSMIPVKTLVSEFKVSNYVSRIGTKIIFNPNIFSKYHNEIKTDSNRILPIEQPKNFTEIDSITFNIPQDYFIENNSNTQIDAKFGNYSTQIFYDKSTNKILYTRKLQINKGIFPASELKEYLSFVKKIISTDNVKVLMKQKSDK